MSEPDGLQELQSIQLPPYDLLLQLFLRIRGAELRGELLIKSRLLRNSSLSKEHRPASQSMYWFNVELNHLKNTSLWTVP